MAAMIKCYLTPEVRSELLEWARVSSFFLLTVLISPIVLLVGLVVLLCRLLVTFHFKLVHEGKFKLVSPTDAAFAVEKYANTITLNAFGYVKGQTNIYDLQERSLKGMIGYKSEDGRQPYEKITWKLLRKYGFFTWEIENDSFDIRDHVRLCPGTNLNTVYSEQDVLDAIASFSDDLMPQKRPQWEMLYVPKVRMSKSKNKTDDDSEDDLHYALIFRAQHAYMDGVSVFQMLHRGLCDEPGTLTIDPVNPPFPKPSTLELIGLYTQAFFTAPYLYYKSALYSPPNVFQETNENTGPKYMRCTTKEITLESVKLIRDKFRCSTIALFNSVISGALRKAATKKNLPIPQEIDFAYTIGVLPYPNEDPQNRFTIKLLKAPLSITDPVKRLHKMNSVMKSVKQSEILALYALGVMIGLLPARFIAQIYATVSCGFAVSNIPGFKEKLHLYENTFEEIYGCPPMKNGVGFVVGVCSYNGNIRACWTVEKSKIISSRDEMDTLIADFENEFAQLECIANENQ